VGQTVACANQKGGVGKTTTVVNLATDLALAGHRILVIDLDPQGNATSGFGVDRGAIEQSSYDVLVNGSTVEGSLITVSDIGVSVVPSAGALAGAEVELATMDGRERRLARALASIAGDYDLVLIDCAPSLGLLTVNALTAADSVLIPLQCEYYALEGLGQLIGTIHLVRDHLNPRLAIQGVLLTMYDARTNLSAEVRSEVRRHLGPVVYEAQIPRSVRLSEAPSHGLPIALYAPESKGARAYDTFSREFGARLGLVPNPARADVSADPFPTAPPITSDRSSTIPIVREPIAVMDSNRAVVG
jgi:chromosome partitioning protein